MRGKVAGPCRLTLSPGEEACALQQDRDRRRRLRLLQVREQERDIAWRIREDVKQRRSVHVARLAEALRTEWEASQAREIRRLERLYLASLRGLGAGHQRAKENAPDPSAPERRAAERARKAASRHREALKAQRSQRETRTQEKARRLKARKEALLVEKERAARVSSLPPPPPALFEGIDVSRAPPGKPSSATYHHLGALVSREADRKQPDAQAAAAEESKRLDGLRRAAAQEQQDRAEQARARGSQALRKLHLAQDQERLMRELERLQQEALARRRRTVARGPAGLAEPPHRRGEARGDRQRALEFAFEDLCGADREVTGDLVLHLEPQPLPTPTGQAQDEELDLSGQREGEPGAETEPPPAADAEPGSRGTEAARAAEAPLVPSKALFRELLRRIRSQKPLWAAADRSEACSGAPPGGSGSSAAASSEPEPGAPAAPGPPQPGPFRPAEPFPGAAAGHPAGLSAGRGPGCELVPGGEGESDAVALGPGPLGSEDGAGSGTPDSDMDTDSGRGARLPAAPGAGGSRPPSPRSPAASAPAALLLHPQEAAARLRTEARQKQAAELERQARRQLQLLGRIEQQRLRLELEREVLARREDEARARAPPAGVGPAPAWPAPDSDTDTDGPRRAIRSFQRQLLQQGRLHRLQVDTARKQLLDYQALLLQRCPPPAPVSTRGPDSPRAPGGPADARPAPESSTGPSPPAPSPSAPPATDVSPEAPGPPAAPSPAGAPCWLQALRWRLELQREALRRRQQARARLLGRSELEGQVRPAPGPRPLGGSLPAGRAPQVALLVDAPLPAASAASGAARGPRLPRSERGPRCSPPAPSRPGTELGAREDAPADAHPGRPGPPPASSPLDPAGPEPGRAAGPPLLRDAAAPAPPGQAPPSAQGSRAAPPGQPRRPGPTAGAQRAPLAPPQAPSQPSGHTPTPAPQQTLRAPGHRTAPPAPGQAAALVSPQGPQAHVSSGRTGRSWPPGTQLPPAPLRAPWAPPPSGDTGRAPSGWARRPQDGLERLAWLAFPLQERLRALQAQRAAPNAPPKPPPSPQRDRWAAPQGLRGPWTHGRLPGAKPGPPLRPEAEESPAPPDPEGDRDPHPAGGPPTRPGLEKQLAESAGTWQEPAGRGPGRVGSSTSSESSASLESSTSSGPRPTGPVFLAPARAGPSAETVAEPSSTPGRLWTVQAQHGDAGRPGPRGPPQDTPWGRLLDHEARPAAAGGHPETLALGQRCLPGEGPGPAGGSGRQGGRPDPGPAWRPSRPPVTKLRCGLDLARHELSAVQEVAGGGPGPAPWDGDAPRACASWEQSVLGAQAGTPHAGPPAAGRPPAGAREPAAAHAELHLAGGGDQAPGGPAPLPAAEAAARELGCDLGSDLGGDLGDLFSVTVSTGSLLSLLSRESGSLGDSADLGFLDPDLARPSPGPRPFRPLEPQPDWDVPAPSARLRAGGDPVQGSGSMARGSRPASLSPPVCGPWSGSGRRLLLEAEPSFRPLLPEPEPCAREAREAREGQRAPPLGGIDVETASVLPRRGPRAARTGEAMEPPAGSAEPPAAPGASGAGTAPSRWRPLWSQLPGGDAEPGILEEPEPALLSASDVSAAEPELESLALGEGGGEVWGLQVQPGSEAACRPAPELPAKPAEAQGPAESLQAAFARRKKGFIARLLRRQEQIRGRARALAQSPRPGSARGVKDAQAPAGSRGHPNRAPAPQLGGLAPGAARRTAGAESRARVRAFHQQTLARLRAGRMWTSGREAPRSL